MKRNVFCKIESIIFGIVLSAAFYLHFDNILLSTIIAIGIVNFRNEGIRLISEIKSIM